MIKVSKLIENISIDHHRIKKEGRIMNLQKFEFEGFNVRTTMIDSRPFFCLKDVCEILEIVNVNNVLDRLKKDGVRSAEVIDSLGRSQQANFINEPNLYKAVIRSDKPNADKFTDWVTEEVLPQIRQTGHYSQKELSRKELAMMVIQIEEEKELMGQKLLQVEKTNAILTHTTKTYTMTEISKELNLKSASELNQILADKKVQFKSNNTWVLYSNYSNLGYEELKQEVLDSGRVIYHRKMTQAGREFILKLMQN